MAGSRPAVRARRAAEVVSRRVISSDRTSSKNSAWPIWRGLASARRSGRSWPAALAGGGGGELGGGPGEPAGQQGALHGQGRRVGFGGPLQHPSDQPDVERFGFAGARAGGVDPLGSPFFDQPEQGVDLAHLGPRQRAVQQGGGIHADGGAFPGGQAAEM